MDGGPNRSADAPIVRLFSASRRVMDCFAMLRVASRTAARVPTPSKPSEGTDVTDDTVVSGINAKLWQDATLKALDVRVS